MAWWRNHGPTALLSGVLLAMLTFAVDARPADPAAGAPAPAVGTRVVRPADSPADSPANGSAATLEFTRTDQPLRLLPGRDRVVRPQGIRRLLIPSIGLDSAVQEVGTEFVDGDLRYAVASNVVGHYRGVDPGQDGNVVLAGHVGTRDGLGGDVFRNLHRVDLGDRIQVETGGGVYEYQVTEIRVVEPDATYLMETTGPEQLTLITCRACTVDCNRLAVIAEPVRNAVAAASAPTSAPTSAPLA